MRRHLNGRALIVGVDRLDYSKGIPERLRGFQALLERYPEHRRQTILMQISAPSREDGLNLVAEEFVAAQDPDDPGVLVLSRFAGAAFLLDAALIVNPYDVYGVGEALHRALAMPLDERQERHRQQLEAIRRNDIQAWRRCCLAALDAEPHA